MRKLIVSIISLLATVGLIYVYFKKELELKYEIILFCLIIITAMFSSFFFIFFLFRNKNKKIKWLENRLEVWNGISYHVNQAGDEAFNQLPVGIVVYDENFEIRWANRYAKSIFQSRLIDSSVESIKDGIIETLKEKETKLTIKSFDRFFDVIHNVENKLLYFFDETSREEVTKKYYERVTAIGIIVIDNLEESLRKFDMQEKSTIRGQILGEISDWVREHNAYLQSYSDDRLVMIFDREALDKMITTRFEILNKIRDISSRNHLKTSVSIGIACYDVDHDELGSLAQNAIELAEKRGGDQVVVNIQNEKIQYFGGKSNALEKNSLVHARVQTMALKEAAENAANIYIMGHNMTDCDSLGSMIGIFTMVKTNANNVKIVFEEEKADTTARKMYRYLIENDESLANNFITSSEATDIRNNTLLIVVDTQSPKIIMFPEILAKIADVIVIDHHRSGEIGFKNPLLQYIEPYASSTVELVCEMALFYSQDVEIKPVEASIMLAGIVVDTNNFTFRTGTRTFEAASTLKGYGADMILVKNFLRDSIEIERELANALLNVEMVLGRFAIVKLDDDHFIDDRTMLARISERLLDIDGVDASFTIGKVVNDDKVAVSARSLETINVQLIMEELGGGGHLNSAATQIKNKTSEEVLATLVDILKREYSYTGDEKMKVILLEDVKGKGTKNQVIEVALGYGNYLLTNKLGIAATEENLKALKDAEEKALIEAQNHRKLMEKLKQDIETKSINIYIKIGADGKTFGHITTKQIVEEFEAQTGIRLDKRKVELPAEINSVGIYTANVTLAKDVVATIEIKVIEK